MRSARDNLRESHLENLGEDADKSAQPLRAKKAELERALVSADSELDKKEIEKQIKDIEEKIKSCYSSYGRYSMKENV